MESLIERAKNNFDEGVLPLGAGGTRAMTDDDPGKGWNSAIATFPERAESNTVSPPTLALGELAAFAERSGAEISS